MDLPSFLYRLSGALDTTAEDLAQVATELERMRSVCEGSRLWSALGQGLHRLDVHTKSLRRLAERTRRRGEQLHSPSPEEETETWA